MGLRDLREFFQNAVFDDFLAGGYAFIVLSSRCRRSDISESGHHFW